MINYNAALPPLPITEKNSINVNNWMNEIKGNIHQLIKSLFADGTQGIYLNAQDAVSVSDLSSIKDLSGRNNHAAQPNATSRATLITDPSGYKSLKFDGIDDSYVTPSINFSNTDKVTVIVGVRKLIDVTRAIVVETGTNVGNISGGFVLAAPMIGGSNSYHVGISGTAGILSTGNIGGYAPPNSAILSLKMDLSKELYSDQLKVRINATDKTYSSANTAQGGNFANNPVYIGRRGGNSAPFNGQIYALLVIGKLLDDATTQRIEKEFAKYIGVTL